MANWSTEPALTQTWANFLTSLKARDESNAKMDYTGDTNIPTGTIRWNNTSGVFQRWDGATWTTLANVAQTANVVPTSRTISAGTGLTGGGNLSANRTLSLANMPQATVKGRAAGAGTGAPTDLTAAQLVAIITAADGAGSGLDADNLDGRSWSEAADPGTIAARTASGYLYAERFNQSSGNAENPTISQIMVTNGTDGFLRKASIAHLEASLGTETSTANRLVKRDSLGNIYAENLRSSAPQDNATVGEIVYRISAADGWYRAAATAHVFRSGVLSMTIQADPGGTPSGSAGHIFFYY